MREDAKWLAALVRVPVSRRGIEWWNDLDEAAARLEAARGQAPAEFREVWDAAAARRVRDGN